MKKLDKQTLKTRREFLKRTVKRAAVPVLVVYSLQKAKADPLYEESRQEQLI